LKTLRSLNKTCAFVLGSISDETGVQRADKLEAYSQRCVRIKQVTT